MGFQLDYRSNLQISSKLTTKINNNFAYLRQATTLSRMQNYSTTLGIYTIGSSNSSYFFCYYILSLLLLLFIYMTKIFPIWQPFDHVGGVIVS